MGRVAKAVSACAVATCLAVPAAAGAATVTIVPAAGPPGTRTTLDANGFPPGAMVLVDVNGVRHAAARTDRSGRFLTAIGIPRDARGPVRVRSSSGSTRVVNAFRAGPDARRDVGDISSETGARLRWSPLAGAPGTPLGIALRQFPRNRAVTVRLGGTALAAGRVDRRGNAVRSLSIPNRPGGLLTVKVETRGRTLRFNFLVTAPPPPPPGARGGVPPVAGAFPWPAIQNVRGATGYRYGARDDKGATLDTLKVIPSPAGGYLGVYHALTAGVFVTKLARSADLLRWNHVVDLERNASQPTIAALSDGGFLVAYEKDAGCTGTGPGGNCLGFRHYADLTSLFAGAGDRSFQAPRTLSRCAEGTPNIYGAELHPDVAHSTIDVGLHYFRNCDVDRQARGTLRNFSAWSASVDSRLNSVFEAFRPGGNIGDRDFVRSGPWSLNLHEVQFTKGAFGSWRVYAYDWLTGVAAPAAIETHRGSTAFANPTITSLLSPAGRPALLVTLFIPSEGAAPTEGGELIYYRELGQ